MIVMYSLKLTVYYFFSVEKLWFYIKLSFDYLFFKFQVQTLCNKIDVRPSNISVQEALTLRISLVKLHFLQSYELTPMSLCTQCSFAKLIDQKIKGNFTDYSMHVKI